VIQFESTLVVASAAGTLAVVVAFIVRGRESGWELSGNAVVTLYVRIASLAGSVVSAIGLAELLRAWMIAAPLPGGTTAASTGLPLDQVVRGATLLVIGAAFWTVHFFLPRPALRGSDALYLVFVTVGAAAFGFATLVTLPFGVADELQRVFGVTTSPRTDRTLGGGLAGLAFWLGHVWQLRAHLGHGRMYRATRAYPDSPPPTAPAVVGAPLNRPPDTRSAGAAAAPPRDR
jgi:hypothetical protein